MGYLFGQKLCAKIKGRKFVSDKSIETIGIACIFNLAEDVAKVAWEAFYLYSTCTCFY